MLFIPKDKIENGDSYNAPPMSLKQVRNANPNISIPEMVMSDMDNLLRVANSLGYEVVEAIRYEDIVGLVGDSFKEKKLTVTSCKKVSGKWKRVFKPEKVHGADLEKYRQGLRGKRNEMLLQSDWTQFSDAPLSVAKKAEWKTYRQQLRDLPKNFDHPVFCKYPTLPKGGE